MTARLEIVEAFAALVTAATGLTVFRNLDFALEDTNLPVAVVESGPDVANDDFSTLEVDAFEASVDVRFLVASVEDREAAADVYEGLLVAALKADRTLGGKAISSRRQGGDWRFDLGDCAARDLTFGFIFLE